MKKYLALIITICLLLCSGCGNDEKSPDPNRTTEKCSYYGTTKVYGTAHQMNATCSKDGDGWYNPAFGHHHHK